MGLDRRKFKSLYAIKHCKFFLPYDGTTLRTQFNIIRKFPKAEKNFPPFNKAPSNFITVF